MADPTGSVCQPQPQRLPAPLARPAPGPVRRWAACGAGCGVWSRPGARMVSRACSPPPCRVSWSLHETRQRLAGPLPV